VNPAVRRALAWGFAAVVTLAIVGLSRVPYAEERTGDGELRLAWRFRSDRMRQCRTLTAEELAKLPAHMRQAEDCRRALRPYRLEITVDGGPASDDTIRARGAESDRPLFVFRRIRLRPGPHGVHVRFSPVGEGGAPPVALDTTLVMSERRVLLVTMDEDAGRLVVRTSPP